MSSLLRRFPDLDFEKISKLSDNHTRLLFDYNADLLDGDIQNELINELMGRYAEVSKELEEKNALLKKHTDHLEELVEEKVKEISESQMATIYALVKAAELRDDDTGTHIERTSSYCRILAEKLLEAGMYPDIVYPDFAKNIERASPLHDIGKIGIEDAILLKPGKLTNDEFAIMKTHVTIGYETLGSVEASYHGNTFLKYGIEISRYHHEKWDGSGYMEGLKGEAIPLSARIMALSDVYDALRSKRVYKEPFSHEKSIGIITEGRGSHFDPNLTDVFLKHDLLFEEVFDRLANDAAQP